MSLLHSLTNNPTDYDLPFPSWYPGQRDMAEDAVNLRQGHVLVVESPCGSGKSGLPATVAHFRPGTVAMMATRDLQTQYANSFTNFAIMWGQRHYDCDYSPWLKKWQQMYAEITKRKVPSRADCPIVERKCPKCPYELAKRRALASDAIVTNYAYAYTCDWWHTYSNDIFCDEAHSLPGTIASLATFEMAHRERKKFGLPQFPEFKKETGGTVKAYRTIVNWASTSVHKMVADLNRLPYLSRNGTLIQRKLQQIRDLRNLMAGADVGLWYIEVNDDGLSARPVFPAPYAHRVMPGTSRSVTLMSATIGDADVLLRELGLSHLPHSMITLPHPFPYENRPVIWLKKSPRINYQSSDVELDLQTDIIADIMRQHSNDRGIINVASWKQASAMLRRLSDRDLESRLYLPYRTDRLGAIERFKHSPSGTVAISPSWVEGLNFPDDEARFTIIAKVPFKSLGDPVVAMRLQMPGGNDEYIQDAANKVAQTSGRIVRSPTDHGITYIVDSSISRVLRKMPAWFRVDIV